jgi:Heterokaryon incompatibility protein (HET)
MLSSFNKRVQKWTRTRIYQKIPLDTTRNHIRLLELLPGMPEDKLTGRLSAISLDQAPNYNAVSYVWGGQSQAFSITLNGGMALRIGRNLHHALRDLRHTEHSIILWIDAICIQQNSDQEQNHQVQLMAQMYSRASTVRAWIDHEMDTRSEIFQRLPDVLNSKDLRADMEYWSPAMNLLQNPYWKRL